ncbi:MAG: trehalose-phosphatase [Alphaproteobacteria bacterium]|nr:MAG: trehalose-phosphatase [Alphaproteobacteria bacterium]
MCQGICTIQLTATPIALPLAEVSLFLDLDGTLAPIVARPDLVGPDPERNGLLSEMALLLEGRLAIISGRSIADVDRITARATLNVAGLHGLERRSERIHDVALPHPGLGEAVAMVDAFAQANSDLLVEKKGLAVALHYREAPSLAAETLALARRVARATGLRLQEGNMVAELRSPGPDKGDVLRAFMAEARFARTTPIFVGDDLTDEDGFAAALALGGYGVLVGPERATQATFRLQDVIEVLRWLETSAASGLFRLVRNP